MTEVHDCPNCNAPLKKSLLKSNQLLSEGKVELINYVNGASSNYYCNKCGDSSFDTAKQKLEDQIASDKKGLKSLAKFIPVITTHNPYEWEYTVLGMVTGQSTTGTGIFSEIGGSVADFFGGQASEYNNKLKGGENLCFEQLRAKTLLMGGNAVVGSDIDYSEVGGGKGMLMVCMAGTAIRLKNLKVLSEEAVKNIEAISSAQAQITLINSLLKNAS